ncbi:MAG: glycosyltransferase family 4 protein [Rhodospirillaceae bacterium]|nr:glycosyltransferase family 4 protein [Rhodospirillaceae bacterium]
MTSTSDYNIIAEVAEQRAISEGVHLNSAPDGRPATILQVLPALMQGGVERGTVEMAQAIVEAGGRAIVASSGGPKVHDLTRVGAEHVLLPMESKNPLVMYANIWRLVRLIRKEKVDIVHARSRAPAWSAKAACKRTRAHLLTTFHGTYSAPNWFKRWYNSVMVSGEQVIVISRFIAGHVRKSYGIEASRIHVIHRGVDLSRFNPAKVSAERVVALANDWRLEDGVPVIMLPGRLTRWKGQTVFIEAIAKLGRRDIRCLLVGSDQGRSDYKNELEKLISSNGLNEVVRIIENCNDMATAYMLTDVVVSASTDPEAFGRVIPEAQALGRPVIATDHGGARETVIEGETGWLVPPGDVDALVKALEHILSLDQAARKRLSDRAIEHVSRNFSRRSMCDKTIAVYNQVLGTGAAS